MQILELWQYPIKGFGGRQTNSVNLLSGGYFPCDRHFAVSTGNEKIAKAKSGTWFKKANFLQLMSHEALAKYNCQYRINGTETELELLHDEKSCLLVNPNSDAGRRKFEDFIVDNFSDHLCGQPRLMHRRDQAYTDQSTALISIVSNAALTAFADVTNTVPDSRHICKGGK